MEKNPENWLENSTAEIIQSATLKELDDIRIRLMGKSGEVTQLLKSLGNLEPELRRQKGAEINQLKDAIVLAIEEKRTHLTEQALQERLISEKIDVTLPVRPESVGTLHPLTRTLEEITSYFSHQGFVVAHGPDIDDEYHNFTALNMPAHHPARQMHDTFYLEEKGKLLRTHTSTVQIRTLKEKKPPLRILSHGRVYRCDSDATHTPMFHQVEGLVIEKGIHMGHLKSCIMEFLRYFFGIADLPIRFRPSFFPFTEPSAEVDIGCTRERGTLKIGAGKDWLEILGCGMVHPKVLANCDIDAEDYQGFAFGMGIDRLTMLKYGLPDLRDFFAGDTRWLKRTGFSPFLPVGA